MKLTVVLAAAHTHMDAAYSDPVVSRSLSRPPVQHFRSEIPKAHIHFPKYQALREVHASIG